MGQMSYNNGQITIGVMQGQVNKGYSTSLNKAVQRYVNDMQVSEPVAVGYSFASFLDNKMLIINAIRQGLPLYLFKAIRRMTPFTDKEWSSYLDLSPKTLHRYEQNPDHIFKPIHSEKIIEVAEVMRRGVEVFGSRDTFHTWLSTPNFTLNNLTPYELLKDSYGKELVMDELNRIEYGIFA